MGISKNIFELYYASVSDQNVAKSAIFSIKIIIKKNVVQ